MKKNVVIFLSGLLTILFLVGSSFQRSNEESATSFKNSINFEDEKSVKVTCPFLQQKYENSCPFLNEVRDYSKSSCPYNGSTSECPYLSGEMQKKGCPYLDKNYEEGIDNKKSRKTIKNSST
jgi:hypothetical protein